MGEGLAEARPSAVLKKSLILYYFVIILIQKEESKLKVFSYEGYDALGIK